MQKLSLILLSIICLNAQALLAMDNEDPFADLPALGFDIEANFDDSIEPQEKRSKKESDVVAFSSEQTELNKTLILEIKKKSPRLKTITQLLQQGANCNAGDEDGITALMHASCKNNYYGVAAVERLIKFGADVNLSCIPHGTALQRCCIAEGTHRVSHGTTCKILIENGAYHPSLDQLFFNAIKSHHTSLYELLLDHGVNVDTKNEYQMTPLMFALIQRNVNLCRLLLEYGANVNTQSKTQSTPLMMTDEPELIALLCDYGADLHKQDKHGRTALAVLTESIKPLIIHSFFNPTYNTRQTILKSREQIFTTLLAFNRLRPKLPRDMRFHLLQCIPELQNAVRCCAFGIHKGHNERAPFLIVQTVRTLLQHDLLNPDLVVKFVKENQYEHLRPLMHEASEYLKKSDFLRFETETKALNPDTLEEQHGAAIEANIRRMFNLNDEAPRVELIEQENEAMTVPEMKVTTRKRERKEGNS